MEEMLHHTRAVRRGVKRALLIGDMPFLSYNASNEQAINNAGRFLKEAGAEAVKLEGGAEMAERVAALDKAGIGVMGHIGLTPQRVSQLGGYGVQGKDEARARQLLDDSIALEEAGAFSLVLEKIPWQLAKLITERLQIPTIGIGAGPYCDGQVLVTNDLLGLSGLSIKFAKRYLNLNELIEKALSEYKQDVKSKRFPTVEEHSFPMSQEIVDKLAGD
jgi:3-methyl-2-oxobutanoate hydroxymethyltransferase